MTNSGKGGFSLTDDPDIAAQAAVNRVAYEAIAPAIPTKRDFKDHPPTLPYY